MTRIKPYNKYKPSGIPWLGQIPEHWEVNKLKYLLVLQKGKNPKDFTDKNISLPYLSMEYLRGKTKTKAFVLPQENLVEVFDGEALVLWDGANAGEIIKSKHGYLSSTMAVIRPNKAFFDENYFFHFLKGLEKEFRDFSSGTTIPHFDSSILLNSHYCLPNISEQIAIANFLDYKTAKIDRFIRKKKQLIKLLNEQKAAIINDAVTKGLNPQAKMKPSGIEWLDNIPEHWEVKNLKYVAKICNGMDCNKQTDGKYPVYGSGGIFAWNEDYIYDKPSVLLGRKGTIDKPILVYDPFWTVDTAFYTKIKTEEVDIVFFYYLCCNIPFGFFSSKTALPSMTQTSLYEVKFPIPELSEQTAIVTHIEKETATINKTIATIEKEIALVQEYRTALIAEAVTGKIDVRSYQISEETNAIEYQELEEELELKMVADEETKYETEEL